MVSFSNHVESFPSTNGIQLETDSQVSSTQNLSRQVAFVLSPYRFAALFMTNFRLLLFVPFLFSCPTLSFLVPILVSLIISLQLVPFPINTQNTLLRLLSHSHFLYIYRS